MKVKTKSKKVNKAWLADHLNDPYVKLAQKEGYRARAAYKLKEIDEVLGLIRPGMRVVDLGSAPGAWSQYLRRRLSPGGAAVGQLDGTILALDPDIPPARQRLMLLAEQGGVAPDRLRWSIDGRAIGRGDQLPWLPWPGRHVIELRDVDGNVHDTRRIEVRGAAVATRADRASPAR